MTSQAHNSAYEDHYSKSFEIDRLWGAIDYGLISGETKVADCWLEMGTLASSTTPLHLIDNISKGNISTKGLKTSSSSEVQLPESAWFVDSNRKIIAFAKASLSRELTGIVGSWWREPLSPQWTIDEGFGEVFKRIGHFARLEPNWDSYDSPSIEKECIGRGISFLKKLFQWREEIGLRIPAPFVAPLSDGGIQFEWEKGTRYLEISIVPKSPTIDYLATDQAPDGELVLEGSLKSQDDLKYFLYYFVERSSEWIVPLWNMIANRKDHSPNEY